MIVKMKKVTLLCMEDDRTASLGKLSDVGVVHITPVAEARSSDLDRWTRELREARSVQLSLQPYAKRTPPSRALTDAQSADPVATAQALFERKDELSAALDTLRKEHMALQPYGDFDPASIKVLADKGVTVKLFHTAGRKPVTPPEGTYLHLIRQDARGQYFAVVGRSEFECEGTLFDVPDHSLAEIEASRDHITRELSGIEETLTLLSREQDNIQARVCELDDKVTFLSAQESMGAGHKVAYLQGFCPVDHVADLQAAAKKHGWGLIAEDPADDDHVPTLVRNQAWVRPINCLFGMLDILPGYREVDIRSVFLLFFTLFFAILVGDAGYGAIFLALAIVARLKMKQAPREPFRLLVLLSLATIAWGAITGNYFGIAHLPAPLRGFEIPWMKDDHNLMAFSFLVGAIHLTVARIWSALRKIKSTSALGEVGWICLTWFMYFLASNMILGQDLPAWSKALFPVGIALLVLFMTPLRQLKHEWADHIMLPFDVIGNFADLVSYVRLFAVGSAGLAVAIAFNELAVGSGIHGPVAAIKASIVLFLGHCLNIVLCLMSILVHGVRLNTLEFSRHVGLEWAGFKYEPFTLHGSGTSKP